MLARAQVAERIGKSIGGSISKRRARSSDAPSRVGDDTEIVELRRENAQLRKAQVSGLIQRGPKAMMPMPTKATAAPIRSQRSGWMRSTSQPQATAIAT